MNFLCYSHFFVKSVVMCESIAKIAVALIVFMTVSLFIYQVKTREKAGQTLDSCAEEYKDFCVNEKNVLAMWKKIL